MTPPPISKHAAEEAARALREAGAGPTELTLDVALALLGGAPAREIMRELQTSPATVSKVRGALNKHIGWVFKKRNGPRMAPADCRKGGHNIAMARAEHLFIAEAAISLDASFSELVRTTALARAEQVLGRPAPAIPKPPKQGPVVDDAVWALIRATRVEVLIGLKPGSNYQPDYGKRAEKKRPEPDPVGEELEEIEARNSLPEDALPANRAKTQPELPAQKPAPASLGNIQVPRDPGVVRPAGEKKVFDRRKFIKDRLRRMRG